MVIYSLPALKSNYFWLVQPSADQPQAYIFDPGDEPPVTKALQEHGLELAGIVITHHHWDHTDGIAPLLQRFPVPVYGPRSERIPSVTHFLADGDTLPLPGFRLQVIATPGHTLDHIVYLHRDEEGQHHLFSADNIFGAGCGKRFEGSAAVFYQSLQKLAALPPQTIIYGSHEYTQDNIRFALAVEPDNAQLRARQVQVRQLRDQGQSTLPTRLDLELATNPFLRCEQPAVWRAAEKRAGRPLRSAVEVFDVLRNWKDAF